eukprot:g1096.t1
MAQIQLTKKSTVVNHNPVVGEKYGFGELETPTFNVKDVEKHLMQTSRDGQLSEEQKKTIANLKQLDKDGDGEISLIEILSLEEDLADEKSKSGLYKKILIGVSVGFLFTLLVVFAMSVAAGEVTKESRVEGGSSVAKSGTGTSIFTSGSERRRLGTVARKTKAAPVRRLARAHHSGPALRRLKKEAKKSSCDTCLKDLTANNCMWPKTDACRNCGQCLACDGGGYKMYQTPICPVLPDGNMDWEKMKQVGVDEELPHHVDPAATEWLSEKYEKYYPDVSKEEAAAFVTAELGKSAPVVLSGQKQIEKANPCGPRGPMETASEVTVVFHPDSRDPKGSSKPIKQAFAATVQQVPNGPHCDQMTIEIPNPENPKVKETIELIGDGFSVSKNIMNELIGKGMLQSDAGKSKKVQGHRFVDNLEGLDVMVSVTKGSGGNPDDMVQAVKETTDTGVVKKTFKEPAASPDPPTEDDSYTIEDVDDCEQCDHLKEKDPEGYCAPEDINHHFYDQVQHEDRVVTFRCSHTHVEHTPDMHIETTTEEVMPGLIEECESITIMMEGEKKSTETCVLKADDPEVEKKPELPHYESKPTVAPVATTTAAPGTTTFAMVTMAPYEDKDFTPPYESRGPKEQVNDMGFEVSTDGYVVDPMTKDPVVVSFEKKEGKEVEMRDPFGDMGSSVQQDIEGIRETMKKRRLKRETNRARRLHASNNRFRKSARRMSVSPLELAHAHYTTFHRGLKAKYGAENAEVHMYKAPSGDMTMDVCGAASKAGIAEGLETKEKRDEQERSAVAEFSEQSKYKPGSMGADMKKLMHGSKPRKLAHIQRRLTLHAARKAVRVGKGHFRTNRIKRRLRSVAAYHLIRHSRVSGRRLGALDKEMMGIDVPEEKFDKSMFADLGVKDTMEQKEKELVGLKTNLEKEIKAQEDMVESAADKYGKALSDPVPDAKGDKTPPENPVVEAREELKDLQVIYKQTKDDIEKIHKEVEDLKHVKDVKEKVEDDMPTIEAETQASLNKLVALEKASTAVKPYENDIVCHMILKEAPKDEFGAEKGDHRDDWPMGPDHFDQQFEYCVLEESYHELTEIVAVAKDFLDDAKVPCAPCSYVNVPSEPSDNGGLRYSQMHNLKNRYDAKEGQTERYDSARTLKEVKPSMPKYAVKAAEEAFSRPMAPSKPLRYDIRPKAPKAVAEAKSKRQDSLCAAADPEFVACDCGTMTPATLYKKTTPAKCIDLCSGTYSECETHEVARVKSFCEKSVEAPVALTGKAIVESLDELTLDNCYDHHEPLMSAGGRRRLRRGSTGSSRRVERPRRPVPRIKTRDIREVPKRGPRVRTERTGGRQARGRGGKRATHNMRRSAKPGPACKEGRFERGCTATRTFKASDDSPFKVTVEHGIMEGERKDNVSATREIPGSKDIRGEPRPSRGLPPDVPDDRLCFNSATDGKGDTVSVGNTFTLKKITEGPMCVTKDVDGSIRGDVRVEATANIPKEKIDAATNECLRHSDGSREAVKACCPSGKASDDQTECVSDGRETYKSPERAKTFPYNGQVHKDIERNATVVELEGHSKEDYCVSDAVCFSFKMRQRVNLDTGSVEPVSAVVETKLRPRKGIKKYQPFQDPELKRGCGTKPDPCSAHRAASDCMSKKGCEFNAEKRKCISIESPNALPPTDTAPLAPCHRNPKEALCTARGENEGKCVEDCNSECNGRGVIDVPGDDSMPGYKKCFSATPNSCRSFGKLYCQQSRSCVAGCGMCEGDNPLIADNVTGRCVAPSPITCEAKGKVFCQETGKCVESCKAWVCGHGDAVQLKDLTSSSGYQTTGVKSCVKVDVDYCSPQKFCAGDPKKGTVASCMTDWRSGQVGREMPYRVSMGMAHCAGGYNNYGMCVSTCHHCHVRSNDEYTIGGVTYEHLNYNNSGVCETTANARDTCLGGSKVWCEALEECHDTSCSDCKLATGEEFTFKEATGGGYECTKRDCEEWESFCPMTMKCVGCNGDDCKSNCDFCPGSPIETWVSEPAYASVCLVPNEERCKDQWMDYCEADKTCKNRWGDSNTCRDCQGESNWSPSSPGKCAKREEVVATCSDQGQYYFNGACKPDCSEVDWEGRQLAANASEAMCSVAQVAEHMEREVTVYANEYMDMESDSTMEGDYSEYAGEEVPPMDGMIGEFDPYDPKEMDTTQDVGMMEDLEKEYEKYFDEQHSQYGKTRRRRRLKMVPGKFEKALPKRAIDDKYNARGGPVKPETTGENMSPLALYDLCAKSKNMAPECTEKAPPRPEDIVTTTETRRGFFCSHYNTIVFDCKKCDCDTMPSDIDGVMTCMPPIPMKTGCDDPKALNYDRCAGNSKPEVCDYDFERFELVPDVELDTTKGFDWGK